MKKTLLISSVFIIYCHFSNAQFTSSSGNTTTTDKIGIGTASPTRNLTIQDPSTNAYFSLNNQGSEKWVFGSEGTQNDRFIIYGGNTPAFK